MAINRNTTFNPSDMNFMDRDFGSMDMDNQSQNRVKKAIKLIFAPMKGLAQGLVDKAIRDNLGNLEEAKDVADSFTSAIGEEYSKFKKEAIEFGSLAKEHLPRSIRSKFKSAFEDEESSEPQESQESVEIRSALTSIFSRSANQQASMTKSLLKSAAADRAVNHAYMKYNASALASVNQSASSINYFLQNVYTKYLEKDIELKYRSLYMTSEIKSHISDVASGFSERGVLREILDAVKPPESKKIKKYGTDQYIADLPKNVAANLFEIPSTIMGFASLGLQSITGMESSPEHTLESIARFIGANMLGKGAMPKSVQDILKHKKVKSALQSVKDHTGILNDDLGFLAKNFSTLINSAGRKLSGSDNMLVSFLGGLIPQFERDTSSKNKAATHPEDPATFDNLTRESIVSVIPKHLERIGNYIESMASAIGAKPPTDATSKTYDVTTRSLISVKEQKRKTEDYIYGSAQQRRAREEESLKVITDNLKVSGAGNDVWSKFNDIKVQKAITTFFNRSGDQHLDIDITALTDFINNGNANFETQEYISSVFGKTDTKTAQAAAQVIYASIIKSDSKGTYLNNQLRRSITNRITNLGKEIDSIEDRRSIIEQRGIYNPEDYEFDENGTATAKNGRRYAGMQGNASRDFVEKAYGEELSGEAQSLKSKTERYERMRKNLSDDEIAFSNKMGETGLDSGILLQGKGLGKAGAKIRDWAKSAQEHIPFLKDWDLAGKMNNLFEKARSKFTNYDNTIFVTRLRLLNKETGEFHIDYRKKGLPGIINVTVNITTFDITEADLEFSGGAFKPNETLKKLSKLIVEAIKKNDDLKNQSIVNKDTEVVCVYTNRFWIGTEWDGSEDDDEDFEEQGDKGRRKGKKTKVSGNKRSSVPNPKNMKSPLELIQEDVRALRIKFVGKPKPEPKSKSKTPKTPKQEKPLDRSNLKDIFGDTERRVTENDDLASDAGDVIEGSLKSLIFSTPLGAKFLKAKEAISPKINTIKGWFGDIKNRFLGEQSDMPKASFLGKILGAIGSVFSIFRKKSASPTEVAQAAAKAGATKGEAVIAGLLADNAQRLTAVSRNVAEAGAAQKQGSGFDLSDALDAVDNVKDWGKMMKNVKFLRNHKWARVAAKLNPSRLLGKSLPRTLARVAPKAGSVATKFLPALAGKAGSLASLAPSAAGLLPGAASAASAAGSGVAATAPVSVPALAIGAGLAASLAEAAALGGMGFFGSRSSGASKTSSAFSATMGALAPLASLMGPQGAIIAPLALAALGANSMREGWNDKKSLKSSWGSGLTATDSQKGATAVGNIANYATFGLLNKMGGRKYVDRALSTGLLGHYVGGIGGQIAGVGDLFRASKRADLGNAAEMTELELKRARAKLQTDIKRGDPEARNKLAQFEKAVKEKDWHTARTVSGVVVNAEREKSDALKRIGKGWLNAATFGMYGALSNTDQNEPMMPDEIKKATKKLQTFAKRNPTAGKKLLLDFEEAVAGERWAVARKICGMENMNWLEKKFGKGAKWKTAVFGGWALLFGNNENEPMKDKEVKAFQDKCMKLIKGGNKQAEQILERFNEAVDLQNWKVARKIAGKETESLFMQGAKAWYKNFRRYSVIGWMFSDQDTPMAQKDIDNFHKKMQYRIEKGYPGAREQLDRFDNAVLTNNWRLARKISGIEHTSISSKIRKAALSLYWGFADKPLTEAEIEKFRASMKRKIDMGDQTAIKILDRFDEAVGNQQWEKARQISDIKNHSLAYKSWAAQGKALKWMTLDWYIGDNDKSLSESDVTKFRERMQKLIDQGNPEAKNMLDQFNDAVEDGNWKKARKIMGKNDKGHLGNFYRWLANSGNDTLHELGDKDKDTGDTAKRYRFILSKVQEALTKKKLKDHWPLLIELRDDMRKMDLLELDDDALDNFQKRLTDIDRSAGMFEKADIESYDNLHRSKMKFIERKQALLSEIKAAEDRCGFFDWSKRSSLKRMFQEVEALSLEELDDETLNGFDEELRLIDNKAMSTKSYDAETQKQMTERLKDTNAILNDIERTREGLGLFDWSARNKLNALQDEIESTLIEDRDDECFEDWNERLREINPHALGSKKYNPEEMKEIRDRIRKRDLLVEAVKEARSDVNRFLHPIIRRRHTNLIDEMESAADDEIDDDMIADWEDRFKELNPDKFKSADDLLEEDDAAKALLRRRDTLVRAIKNAKRNAKRSKDDKTASKLEDLVDRLHSLDDDEVTEATLNGIEKEFNELIKDKSYEQGAKNVIAEANKNMAEAQAKVQAEKNKPIELTAGNISTYRRNMNADNLIGDHPVTEALKNGTSILSPSANKAFARATRKIRSFQFNIDKKAKFDMESGIKIVLYSVNGGEWFALTDLRKQPIEVQLMILASEVDNTGKKWEQQGNDDKSDQCENLHEKVLDLIESKSATEKDLAKLEYEAAMLGVAPYSNPKLYNLQVLEYDPKADAQEEKAEEIATSSNRTLKSILKSGFAKYKEHWVKGFGVMKKIAKKLDVIGLSKVKSAIISPFKKMKNGLLSLLGKNDETPKEEDKSSGNGKVTTRYLPNVTVNLQGYYSIEGSEPLYFRIGALRQRSIKDQLVMIGWFIGSFKAYFNKKSKWECDFLTKYQLNKNESNSERELQSDEIANLNVLLHDVFDAFFSENCSIDTLAELEYRAYLMGIPPYSTVYKEGASLEERNWIDPLPITEEIQRKAIDKLEAVIKKNLPPEEVKKKSLKDKLKGAFNSLKNKYKAGAKGILGFASSIKDRAKSLIGSAKESISNAASSLKEKAKSFISPLANAGLNLIPGYRNGMLSDKYNSVMNYMKDIRSKLNFSDEEGGLFGGAGASNRWDAGNFFNLFKDKTDVEYSKGNTPATVEQNKPVDSQAITNDLMKDLIKDNKDGSNQVTDAVNSSNELLSIMCGKLDNVVAAILEHNDLTNEKIGLSTQQSYDLMKAYTNNRFGIKKPNTPPLFKPSVISINKV